MTSTPTSVVPGIVVRAATPDDAAAIGLLLSNSFGFGHAPPDERLAPVFPPGGALVATDGDTIVGHTNSMTMTLTVPGGHTTPVCGVSQVGVAPTHRRRGILRAMYSVLHDRIEDAGLPIGVFTASQATIYGRFGYGPAVRQNRVSIDRRFAEFLPGTPDPGGATVEVPAHARDSIVALYDRWQRRTPGAQARPQAAWDRLFADQESERDARSSQFALVHPEGYALYRFVREGDGKVASVEEFRTVSEIARAALWRALLGLDLITSVRAEITDHDPLPYLLTDHRLVRTTDRVDGLWLRTIDVPAALSARGYARDLDVVLAVSDPFRDAGGTFALRVRDGRAECAPTTRAPDAELGIDVLGSLYLGAHRADTFAAANRLRGEPTTVRALTEAFADEREAQLGWFF